MGVRGFLLQVHIKFVCVWPQPSLTLFDSMDCSPPGSSVHGFSWQEYWRGCHFFLQGTFPTQELNPHVLCLLHCRQVLYPLSHWGSPHMKCRREKRVRERLSLVKVCVPPHSFLSILPSFSLLSSLPYFLLFPKQG